MQIQESGESGSDDGADFRNGMVILVVILVVETPGAAADRTMPGSGSRLDERAALGCPRGRHRRIVTNWYLMDKHFCRRARCGRGAGDGRERWQREADLGMLLLRRRRRRRVRLSRRKQWRGRRDVVMAVVCLVGVLRTGGRDCLVDVVIIDDCARAAGEGSGG
jgi:hypothetical protein